MGMESQYHSKKDRVFVRGIQGHYSLKEELARLRAMPRVSKGSRDQVRGRPAIVSAGTTSSRWTASRRRCTSTSRSTGPGGASQKHGHVNEAAFYILDGRGYEIHDGVRYDWKAGDVAIVHNNCVHQHFNAERGRARPRAGAEGRSRCIMFMNMLFQKKVIPRPTEPAPGGDGFKPRERRGGLQPRRD